MNSLSMVSLLLLSVLVSFSWTSPIIPQPNDPFNSPGISPKNIFVERRAASTCSSSWIQAAETRANKGPHQTISSLCSSLQGKYKTVTHSVYTKTVTPRTTINTVTTAPRRVITDTRTSEITQQSTDVEESTSELDITVTATETTVVETDIVTVTALPIALAQRNEYPCQEIESLLTLSAGSATPFCSCYDTGPTSTKTVTCDGATTAPEVHATHYTKTVTPTSTAFTTVFQTTTVVTTVELETVVTSIANAETTLAVTDIVTTTVPLLTATATGLVQVQDTTSPYNGFYASLDLGEQGYDFRLVQFTSDKSAATTFSVDDSNTFRSGDFTMIQDLFTESNDGLSNDLRMYPQEDLPLPITYGTQPRCYVSPLSELTCNDLAKPGDTRAVLSICPNPPTEYLGYFGTAPYLVLDTVVVTGCDLAVLFIS